MGLFYYTKIEKHQKLRYEACGLLYKDFTSNNFNAN